MCFQGSRFGHSEVSSFRDIEGSCFGGLFKVSAILSVEALRLGGLEASSCGGFEVSSSGGLELNRFGVIEFWRFQSLEGSRYNLSYFHPIGIVWVSKLRGLERRSECLIGSQGWHRMHRSDSF